MRKNYLDDIDVVVHMSELSNDPLGGVLIQNFTNGFNRRSTKN